MGMGKVLGMWMYVGGVTREGSGGAEVDHGPQVLRRRWNSVTAVRREKLAANKGAIVRGQGSAVRS